MIWTIVLIITSLFFIPPLFGLIALSISVIIKIRKRNLLGFSLIFLSIIAMVIGLFLGAANKAQEIIVEIDKYDPTFDKVNTKDQ